MSESIIEQFCDQIWMEQGLSDATLSSYRSDLKLFNQWLQKQGKTLTNSGASDIQQYLAERYSKQYSSRSTARFLSSARKFYRYLLQSNHIKVDPTQQIESPKIQPPYQSH